MRFFRLGQSSDGITSPAIRRVIPTLLGFFQYGLSNPVIEVLLYTWNVYQSIIDG